MRYSNKASSQALSLCPGLQLYPKVFIATFIYNAAKFLCHSCSSTEGIKVQIKDNAGHGTAQKNRTKAHWHSGHI